MVLRLAAVLALGLWSGAALFFTATSRVPFDTLGREAAGRLATAMFPRYYAWQVAAAAVAAPALAADGAGLAAALAGAGGLLAAVAWLGIAPRLGRAARGSAEWGRLHGLSVALNLGALLAALAALLFAAA